MKTIRRSAKGDAVALYQSRPVATIRQLAAYLWSNPETLRNWVRAAGARRPRGRQDESPTEPPTPLEADNAALRRQDLEDEREIPTQSGEVFLRDALVNRFQFVADHQRRYGARSLSGGCAVASQAPHHDSGPGRGEGPGPDPGSQNSR
jgi:transposase